MAQTLSSKGWMLCRRIRSIGYWGRWEFNSCGLPISIVGRAWNYEKGQKTIDAEYSASIVFCMQLNLLAVPEVYNVTIPCILHAWPLTVARQLAQQLDY